MDLKVVEFCWLDMTTEKIYGGSDYKLGEKLFYSQNVLIICVLLWEKWYCISNLRV